MQKRLMDIFFKKILKKRTLKILVIMIKFVIYALINHLIFILNLVDTLGFVLLVLKNF